MHPVLVVQPALVVLPAPMRTDIASADAVSGDEASDEANQSQSEAELRRQMYERIAQGGAMAEAEEHASRLWTNR